MRGLCLDIFYLFISSSYEIYECVLREKNSGAISEKHA